MPTGEGPLPDDNGFVRVMLTDYPSGWRCPCCRATISPTIPVCPFCSPIAAVWGDPPRLHPKDQREAL